MQHSQARYLQVCRAMQHFPDCEVTTCHNYDIHYAFRWQCTNNG